MDCTAQLHIVLNFVFRSNHLWLNTRMYLVNMAISDIIMCITAVPITPYTAFQGTWVFGKSFCHLLPLFQVINGVLVFAMRGCGKNHYHM